MIGRDLAESHAHHVVAAHHLKVVDRLAGRENLRQVPPGQALPIHPEDLVANLEHVAGRQALDDVGARHPHAEALRVAPHLHVQPQVRKVTALLGGAIGEVGSQLLRRGPILRLRLEAERHRIAQHPAT